MARINQLTFHLDYTSMNYGGIVYMKSGICLIIYPPIWEDLFDVCMKNIKLEV